MKKETARAKSKQRDIGAATPGLPFKQGATLSQQIEIAKLQAAKTFKERRTLYNDNAIALVSIQKDIDNHSDLVKLWDRINPMFQDQQTLWKET